MAASQLFKLSSTGAADNTPITATNMGVSSVSLGAGNTSVCLMAAAMGDVMGYRLGQVTNTTAVFCDFSAAAICAPRLHTRVGAITTLADPGVAIARGYSDGATHTATIWTLYLTNTGKLRFVEASTSPAGISIVSTASITANTEYVVVPIVNSVSGAVEVKAYPWGNPSATVSVTGTLANPSVAVTNSMRLGLGNTSSAVGNIDFSESTAVFGLTSSSDAIPRTDVPVATVNPAVGQGSYTTTVTLSGLGTAGTKSGTINWGDGSGVSSSTTPPTWSKTLTPPSAGGADIVYTIAWTMSSTAP
jgi:hypothetical protein